MHMFWYPRASLIVFVWLCCGILPGNSWGRLRHPNWFKRPLYNPHLQWFVVSVKCFFAIHLYWLLLKAFLLTHNYNGFCESFSIHVCLGHYKNKVFILSNKEFLLGSFSSAKFGIVPTSAMVCGVCEMLLYFLLIHNFNGFCKGFSLE